MTLHFLRTDVADTAHDRHGGDDGCRLDGDTSEREPAEREAAATDCSAAAHDGCSAGSADRRQPDRGRGARGTLEERQREWQGEQSEALEGTPLCALGCL